MATPQTDPLQSQISAVPSAEMKDATSSAAATVTSSSNNDTSTTQNLPSSEEVASGTTTADREDARPDDADANAWNGNAATEVVPSQRSSEDSKSARAIEFEG